MPWTLHHHLHVILPGFACQITQEVRDYAAQKGLDEQAALDAGMKEKAEEFKKTSEVRIRNPE